MNESYISELHGEKSDGVIAFPLYRAKKIEPTKLIVDESGEQGYYSDEYVEGQFCFYKGYPRIFNEYGLDGEEIDPSTLAIHFPDMIDSEGTKIFASLSEDGKGGDTASIEAHYEGDTWLEIRLFTVTIEQGEYNFEFTDIHNYGLKVTGIQE